MSLTSYASRVALCRAVSPGPSRSIILNMAARELPFDDAMGRCTSCEDRRRLYSRRGLGTSLRTPASEVQVPRAVVIHEVFSLDSCCTDNVGSSTDELCAFNTRKVIIRIDLINNSIVIIVA